MSHFPPKNSQEQTRRCGKNTVLSFKCGSDTVKRSFNTNHFVQVENCVLVVDTSVLRPLRLSVCSALARGKKPAEFELPYNLQGR